MATKCFIARGSQACTTRSLHLHNSGLYSLRNNRWPLDNELSIPGGLYCFSPVTIIASRIAYVSIRLNLFLAAHGRRSTKSSRDGPPIWSSGTEHLETAVQRIKGLLRKLTCVRVATEDELSV